MNKRNQSVLNILVFSLLLLVFSCDLSIPKKEDIASWTTKLEVPMLEKTITFEDIIEDSLIKPMEGSSLYAYTKEVGVHIGTGSADNGAVCFSRDGSFFGEKNKLNDSTNSNQINLNLEGRNTNNYLIICPASSSGGSMSVGGGSGSCGSLKPQYLVEWSRFGNIKKFKWSGSAWTRQ